MASLISRIFIGMVLLAAATGAARADFSDGKMPDGTYHCEVYLLGMFLNLGDITIKGNVYTGPVTFGAAQQAYNYQMDANGVISLARTAGRLHRRWQLAVDDPGNAGWPEPALLRHHHEAARRRLHRLDLHQGFEQRPQVAADLGKNCCSVISSVFLFSARLSLSHVI